MSDIVLKLYDDWTRTSPTPAHIILGDILDYSITDNSGSVIDTAHFVINDTHGKWRSEIDLDYWNGTSENTQVWRAFSRDNTLIGSGVVVDVSRQGGKIVLEGEGMTSLMKRRVIREEFFHDDDGSSNNMEGEYILLNATYGLVYKYLGTTYGSITADSSTPVDTDKRTWKFDGVTLLEAAQDVASASYGSNGYPYEVYLYESYDGSDFTLKCYFREMNEKAITSTLRMSDVHLPTFYVEEKNVENYNRVIVRGETNPNAMYPKDGDGWTDDYSDVDYYMDSNDTNGVDQSFSPTTTYRRQGDFSLHLSRDSVNDGLIGIIQDGVIYDFDSSASSNVYTGHSDYDYVTNDYSLGAAIIDGDMSEDPDNGNTIENISDTTYIQSNTSTEGDYVYIIFEIDMSDFTEADVERIRMHISATGGGTNMTDGWKAYWWNWDDSEWDAGASDTSSYGTFGFDSAGKSSTADDYIDYDSGSNKVHILVTAKDDCAAGETLDLKINYFRLEVIEKSKYLVDNKYHSLQFACLASSGSGSDEELTFEVTLGVKSKYGNRDEIALGAGGGDPSSMYKKVRVKAWTTVGTEGTFMLLPPIPLPNPDNNNGWENTTDTLVGGVTNADWHKIYQVGFYLGDDAGEEIDDLWIDELRFIGNIPYEGVSPASAPTYAREYIYTDKGLKSNADCENMAKNILGGLEKKQYGGTATLKGIKRDYTLKSGYTVGINIPSKGINESKVPITKVVYTPNQQTLTFGREYSTTEIVNRIVRKVRLSTKSD